ncbi:MAG: cupin domain-containing protein [Candidatus Omnitrophota bacterium]
MSLRDDIEYQDESIVSREILKKEHGTVTLFAFDEGQGLSEHTAPFDALIQIIEGQAEVTIGGKAQTANEGDLVTMPANIPHAVQAQQRFKMLLVMIKSQ